MKDVVPEVPALKKCLKLIDTYKYVLLILAVGVLLLMMPFGEEKAEALSPVSAHSDTGDRFDLPEMERKLSAALSRVEGAGDVTVILTVQNSSRQVLAQDGKNAQKNGETERTAETVVISKGGGTQEPVLVEQIYPEFQGALVVCTGGENAAVRLKLVEAVSALTGLGADKISICKGK